MCKFCEKIYKPSDIIDAPKIVYGNYCGNDSDMYYISVPTDDGIDYSIDNIKFCPICGRKLVKEWNIKKNGSLVTGAEKK